MSSPQAAGVFVDLNSEIGAMDLVHRMVTEGQLPSQWRAGNALPNPCPPARSHLCEIRAYCDSGDPRPNPEQAFRSDTLTQHPALRDRVVLAWVCRYMFYPTYAEQRFGLFPTTGSLAQYMGQPARSSVPVITIETPLGIRPRPSVDAYLPLIRYFLTNAPSDQVSRPIRR